MSDNAFSVPEINLLLSLVHLRGAGDTGVFRVAFGYDKVEGNMRDPLVKKGLITVDKGVRPYQYELTDAGWRAAREALSEPGQTGLSNRTARILWAVIRDIAVHMGKTGIELADIYADEAAEVEAVEVETDETVDTDEADAEPQSLGERIVASYRELSGEQASWIPLAALRKHLDGEEHSEVDKSLQELLIARKIQLIPEANQKTLTDADRAAAVWVGGEYRHLIGIEVR
ncbi:hypothetical protein [Glycomyces sp. NPDC047010]|uniref:hypothetical protein n=1 Tax=Glycomyces sp. NPDC047010 TaxID=3155023 RepID=UPI0033E2D711